MTRSRVGDCVASGKLSKPAFNLILDGLTNSALQRLGRSLSLECLASVSTASGIESLLQNTVLPAEDVITMLAVTSAITHGVDEGLGSVGGPDALVVENSSVPHDFIHELRETNWVCRRARTGGFECAA